MALPSEHEIHTFVQHQFPAVIRDEGPMFVEFTKAYYEWLDSEDGAVYKARTLYDNRDVDYTVDEFVTHFNDKYLYGIPDTVKGDKRFMIKHILDVYRSKGTVQGFKLLFRLLYNESIDVYLPQIDVLKPSDGTWYAPKYIEASPHNLNRTFVGKRIKGSSSAAEAVVQEYARQVVNNRVVDVLYLSTVSGTFSQNEKIIDVEQYATVATLDAPRILGSGSSLAIIDGGQNFNVGDILVPTSGTGREIEFRVATTALGDGTMSFFVDEGGTYYSVNAIPIITRSNTNTSRSSFNVTAISGIQSVTYCVNVLQYFDATQVLNATSWTGMSGTPNLSSNISSALTYTTQNMGTIAAIGNVSTVTSISEAPAVHVKDFIYSANLAGTLTVSNTTANVVGTSTSFSTYFVANGYVRFNWVNGANVTTEHRIVKTVSNNTHMILDDIPNKPSTTSVTYNACVPAIQANFTDDQVRDPIEGTIGGNNAIITAAPQYGSGVVATVDVKNSGLGYKDDEVLILAPSGAIANVTIVTGGVGYANNENLVFSGGSASSPAVGSVLTNANGTVTSVNMIYFGSGYQSAPVISVQTSAGSGASFTCTSGSINSSKTIKATLVKAGVGQQKGRWTTTRGMLNSDKYITDSYYYQDFSYEIQAPLHLEKYADILKTVFHPSGHELFGKVVKRDVVSANSTLVSESVTIS